MVIKLTGWRLGVVILISIMLIVTGYFGWKWLVQDMVAKRLEKAVATERQRIESVYTERVESLEGLIKEKDKEIQQSQKRYDSLKAKIQQKVDEANQVTKPKTDKEAIERIKGMGYGKNK